MESDNHLPFDVWSLKTDLPLYDDEPHSPDRKTLHAVSVHFGLPFGDGPGAIVTTYHPELTFTETRHGPEDNCAEVSTRGALALGRQMALRLTNTPAQGDLPTGTEPYGPYEPGRHHVQDITILCDDTPVPALELGVDVPGATVIVSADLRCHPIVLGLWGWHATRPALEKVSFK